MWRSWFIIKFTVACEAGDVVNVSNVVSDVRDGLGELCPVADIRRYGHFDRRSGGGAFVDARIYGLFFCRQAKSLATPALCL